MLSGYSHNVCCLLYYLDEIDSGIHMYQFTFKPLHFCFPVVVRVADLNKTFGGSTDLAKKRHGSADFYTPIHPFNYDTLGLKNLAPVFRPIKSKTKTNREARLHWFLVYDT